jgi:hypothetical protein
LNLLSSKASLSTRFIIFSKINRSFYLFNTSKIIFLILSISLGIYDEKFGYTQNALFSENKKKLELSK